MSILKEMGKTVLSKKNRKTATMGITDLKKLYSRVIFSFQVKKCKTFL